MSLCKVKKIKSNFKGVGPSYETIHHHINILKSIGVSPTKRGPDGNTLLHHYKSLFIEFAKNTRICQLNMEVSTCKKQIQWIKSKLQHPKQKALMLWERLMQDTAIDMKVTGKIKYAEEQHVKWTVYSNLEL